MSVLCFPALFKNKSLQPRVSTTDRKIKIEASEPFLSIYLVSDLYPQCLNLTVVGALFSRIHLMPKGLLFEASCDTSGAQD